MKTFSPALERQGHFSQLAPRLRGQAVLALVDARVLTLHPHVGRALARAGARVLRVTASERAKSLATLERLTKAALDVPRGATVLAIGGGTVGDLATVFAHTFKRGVARFLQVPTTVLAAVDSSVGGKGAVNAGGAKNVLGVFHFADECWLCPELFESLSEAQRREGRLEAWKMVVTLSASAFDSLGRWGEPELPALVRLARGLKNGVVARDPYETRGHRVVLNFGHTFGHALEAASGFRLTHGDAVGLGMLVALEVGVALGVTPKAVARAVEAALPNAPNARATLASWLRKAPPGRLARLLAADKKGQGTMVLLERPGRWRVVQVSRQDWAPVVRALASARVSRRATAA